MIQSTFKTETKNKTNYVTAGSKPSHLGYKRSYCSNKYQRYKVVVEK